ncbi:MAG: bile acid:sodium symporter family protein [Rhodospirillales bacterium]|nr:bile acid:sodium symporter family protein [Rhodospirillales bacterium]
MIELSEINYDQGQQMTLNLVLAVMVFGLALDIRIEDFKRVFRQPKAPVVALVAQFFLLPAITCLLTLLIDLPPGIELGMILVAACPGGAVSNFITYLARGNVALSISMTAFSSLIAIFMMPFNFAFWASFNSEATELLRAIDVSGVDIFKSLLIVLAAPLLLGQIVANKLPKVAAILHRILRHLSVVVLFAFIGIAVFKNMDAFAKYFFLLFVCVLAHNGTALALGFVTAKLAGLKGRDTRAVTIEVGIQNSSLAIAIIFSQFDGQAGMALIAAFWGTWHIVSGLAIATAVRLFGKDDPDPYGLGINP